MMRRYCRYSVYTVLFSIVLLYAGHLKAQSLCNNTIPPFTTTSELGLLQVNHNLVLGVTIWNGGSGIICPYLFPNFTIQNNIGFGPFVTLTEPCESFVYELLFSRPINEISFILHTGGGGPIDGPDGGSEIHVFEPSNKIQNIESIWSCNSSVISNQIFLGDVPLEYHGSGEFTINFYEPVCSFTISGNGCWGGSGFVICTNSIQTPDLWASMELVEQACSEDSIQFTAYGSVGPYIFEYSVNGGAVQQLVSNEPSVTISAPPSPGTYVYELLTITDGNGNLMNITCNNSLTVQVPEPLLAQFTASPTSGFAPLSIILQNQSSNATNYSWFVNEIGGFDTTQPPASTAENPMFTLNDTGVYEITLVAFKDLGCSDTTVQTVHVLEQLQVVIPNVFTPNNDGINDWFGITSNVEANASIVILNRWGNVLFEKEFVTTPNVFEPLWDGTSAGSGITVGSGIAADGVYFYRGRVGEEEFSGFVHLKK